jgi:phosphorylcholine metabolism protein LicD
MSATVNKCFLLVYKSFFISFQFCKCEAKKIQSGNVGKLKVYKCFVLNFQLQHRNMKKISEHEQGKTVTIICNMFSNLQYVDVKSVLFSNY